MNTLVIVLIAALCLFGAYTLYGRWLANKWGIDPTAKTPAVVHEDGRLASHITDKQLHLGVHIVCRRVVTRGRFAGAPAAQTATALVGDEPLAALAQRVHTIGNFTR